MRFSTAAIFSTLAAFAAAYTQPDYSKGPEGNPIYTPSLNEQVPEGAPFKITWNPTLGKKVSLVLLRGPSSNVKPLETIVENIDNTGSYTWTPSTNLEVDTTHYGLLLVVEGTGQYQWSTQFGIAKGSGPSSASSSVVTVIDDVTTTICPESESKTAAPTTTPATSTPASIVTVIDDVTTTICPEESKSKSLSRSASATPVVTPSVAATPSVSATPSISAAPAVSATSSFSVVTAWSEYTTTICPESKSATPITPSVGATSVPLSPIVSLSRVPKSSSSSAVPSGTASASVSPSATPFSGAGRNAASFGAVMAGVVAFMAL